MHKSFFIYLPSVLLPRLSSFILILIGSNFLPVDKFGYYSLIVVIGEFSEMSFTNWIRIALVRFGSSKEQLPLELVTRVCRIAIFCCCISILISMGVIFAIAKENFLTLFLCVTIYILSNSAIRLGVSLNQSQDNKVVASSIESSRATVSLAVGAALMVLNRDFVYASLCGSAVGIPFAIFALRHGIARTAKAGETSVDMKVLLHFAVPLITLAIFSFTITSLDKALMKTYFGTVTLGYYSAAFTFARSGFDVIANAFNIGGFVQISALSNQGRHDEVPRFLSRQMAHISAIALPAAGVFIGSRYALASTFFPAGYYETFVTATPIVAFGAIALNIKNFVYDNVFYIRLRNILQIPPLAIGAAISAILGVTLLPHHPQLGAATMFALGSGSSLVASILFSRRLVTVPLPSRQLLFSTSLGVVGWVVTRSLHERLSSSLPPYATLAILGVIGGAIIALSSLLSARQEKVSPRAS